MNNLSIESDKFKTNYILFDVETTGLPKKRQAPISDYDNWPNIVQIAWILYSEDGECLSKNNYIIKPDNYEIPEDSIKVHGITNEFAKNNGQNVNKILDIFALDTYKAEYLIAHNLEFDYKIVASLFERYNIKSNISKLKKICTMQCATDFCKIGDFKYNKYKWPKLSELYYKLFDKHADGLHDALVDIEVCNQCLNELKKKDIINF